MKEEDIDRDQHEEKLVTVAIHTYEQALVLQSILESAGIPAFVHGVRLIEPTMEGNLRVRIRETDLSKALAIIEKVDFTPRTSYDTSEEEAAREVLIPVDFSDYSMVACDFGFHLAHDLNCEVKLLNSFFTSFYPTSIPFTDSFPLQLTDSDLYKDAKRKTEKEMEALVKEIEKAIAAGSIPKVPYKTMLFEGLPEEQIIGYSKKIRPTAIVMGTRGKNAKELDLIGSVTAEVMEGCRTPIFAIPEGSKVSDISQMKRIVFLTNFQEREFKAFSTMMTFLKPYPIKVYLAHITRKEDAEHQIRLSAIQQRFAQRYPQLQTEYKLIDRNVGLEETLEAFVKEHAIDMIALSSSRRNIFARMFNPGIARRMLFHSDTPLLVIKGM